ncbi:hypothetical protein F4780DRAFT_353997 [Xylariomycetidae sp. FL0641]|nr:hypothetical protein F4780DRAFT_353997 [Xylariomycetidae sp. FL0641]
MDWVCSLFVLGTTWELAGRPSCDIAFEGCCCNACSVQFMLPPSTPGGSWCVYGLVSQRWAHVFRTPLAWKSNLGHRREAKAKNLTVSNEREPPEPSLRPRQRGR